MATFEGWAHVEMMGHSSVTGYVRTLYFGNVAILEVTQPEIAKRRITLTESGYCDGPDNVRRLYPAGTEVEVSLAPGQTLAPVQSLYRLTPMSEAQAMARIPTVRQVLSTPGQLPPAPVSPVSAYASCKNCGDHAELDSDGLCEDCQPEVEF
jgi:hypothetical protein